MQYEKGVSVVIPCYNREEYLRECLQSVLDQEHDFPVEIIVADDGSEDRSMEITQTMSASTASDPSARAFVPAILPLPKPADCQTRGAGPTRNRGIAQARYSYIAFLDSDDLFLPGHLKRLFHFLENENNAEVAATVDQLYGFAENIAKRWIMPYLDTDVVHLETFFLSPYFNPSVAMIRHTVLDMLEGPFEETLRFAQDIDLFFRILEQHTIAIVPGEGAGLREHLERSTRGKSPYLQYEYAEKVFQRAIARYPYPKKLQWKRRATLHFRRAEGALWERHYFSAVKHLLAAFFLDPVRAIQTVLGFRRK